MFYFTKVMVVFMRCIKHAAKASHVSPILLAQIRPFLVAVFRSFALTPISLNNVETPRRGELSTAGYILIMTPGTDKRLQPA
jgi:hypothetical protein